MVTPRDLLSKAVRAADSAQLLLSHGDIDGACNRAYYAMFDAARAALLASGAPVEAKIARTHSGLIAAFGLHVVRPGLVLPDWGRALNRAEEIRLVADYTSEEVDIDLATWLVGQSGQFVEVIQQRFSIAGSQA